MAGGSVNTHSERKKVIETEIDLRECLFSSIYVVKGQLLKYFLFKKFLGLLISSKFAYFGSV